MKNIRKKKKEPEIELFQAEKCIEPFRRLNEQLKFVWYKLCNYTDVHNTNGFLPLFVDWVVEQWVRINKDPYREDVILYYQLLQEEIMNNSVQEWLESFFGDCMRDFFDKEIKARKITLPEELTTKDITNLKELLFSREGFSTNEFDKPELVKIYTEELYDTIHDLQTYFLSLPSHLDYHYLPTIDYQGHFHAEESVKLEYFIDAEEDTKCKFSFMKLEDFKDLRSTLKKIQKYNQIPSISPNTSISKLWIF